LKGDSGERRAPATTSNRGRNVNNAQKMLVKGKGKTPIPANKRLKVLGQTKKPSQKITERVRKKSLWGEVNRR